MLRKPHKLRVILLGVIFSVLAGAVVARLAFLQQVNHEHYERRARGQHVTAVVLQAERGDILDRRGRPLAASTGTLSIYIDRAHFAPEGHDLDLERIAGQAAYYLQQSPARVLERITGGESSPGKGVVALGRQLDPVSAERIGDLFANWDVPRRAYWFHRESKRLYPRSIAPHVVGFTTSDGDGDNQGLAGLEIGMDSQLAGRRIESSTFRSGISQILRPFDEEDLLDARGNTLVLTIDAAIQEAAEAAVAAAAAEFGAAGAGAVAMDVHTGEILALANWPTFDNNAASSSTSEQRRNRILTDPFEPGSVAKLWTAAILLDLNLIEYDTLIDCEGGRAIVDGRRLQDSPGHYLNVVPFHEVIRHSSNVGAVKAGQRLDNARWFEYLRAFGFGEPTGIDLPGEGGGLLYNPSKWTRLSRTSLPMGYEIGVTPMQTVAAIAALVNGGELVRPHVVREVRDSRGNIVMRREREVVRRVLRPSTSAIMRKMMQDVVDNGTGKKAAVEGYTVGGKTGTTRKSHITTHREYISSFAGVIPCDQPRVAIYVFVDSPQGACYASTVAAPTFRAIAESAMLHLGVTPQRVVAPEVAVAAPAAPAAQPEAVAVEPGAMPDLRGMTVAQALVEMARLAPESLRLLGSGRAVDQFPAPGAAIEPGAPMIVVFDPSGQRRPSATSLFTAARTTP